MVKYTLGEECDKMWLQACMGSGYGKKEQHDK
jgi:hypothetical protein